MSYRKRPAFTLIELLVVISIIGLLATITVVSMANSENKAAVASGLQFEASVQHAVGSDVVAMWDFDDGSGTSATDTSGNGNVATLHPGVTWACASANPSNTPSGQGCSLHFSGSSSYVSTAISNVNDGTVSFWFNTQNISTYQLLAGKRTSGCFGTGIYVNPPNILQIYNAGPETLIAPVQQGKWYNLVVVRTGAGAEADFYLNGRLALKNAYNLNLNDLVDTIGSSCAGASALNGYMDNVRIYGTALGASRIEKIYAEEKAKYES